MENLMSLGAETSVIKIKEAHGRSISTSNHRAEGIALVGKNLEETFSAEANSSYSLNRTTIDNYSETNPEKKETSFYLGASSGRIADRKKGNYSLTELSEWIDKIENTIREKKSPQSELLKSYAKTVDEIPQGVEPLSFVLDTMSLSTEISLTVGNNEFIISPDINYYEYSQQLKLFEKLEVNIVIDPEKKIPTFTGTECTITDSGKDFYEWINKQPLKVLYPEGLSYFDKAFYRVQSPQERGINLKESKWHRYFHSLSALDQRGLTEKGTACPDADSFDTSSVFHLIDELKTNSGPFAPYIRECDLVLCTDMGKEPADFIISSEVDNKICFVHVKCGDFSEQRGSAAGNIAEVGGQAIKNINYLTDNKDSTASLIPNLTLVSSSWKASPHVSGEVEHRLRMLDGKRAVDTMTQQNKTYSDVLKSSFETLLARRKSDAYEKEIWIVVGNKFSKSHFFDKAAEESCGIPTTYQSYQLIDSWFSTANAYDVTLKFFVKE